MALKPVAPPTPTGARFDRGLRRVFEGARKSRLSAAERKQMVDAIRTGLRANPDFFDSLKPPNGNYWDRNLRVFRDGKKSVVVKRVGGGPEWARRQGINFREYLRFYAKYRQALKKGEIAPQRYVLVRLQPIAAIAESGLFLVMEHVREDSHSRYSNRRTLLQRIFKRRNKEVRASLYDALDEFHRHHSSIKAPGTKPQFDHTLVLGNTNAREPTKGKWVLALPHDRT